MKTNKWISITLAAVLNLGGLLTTTSLGADTAAPAHGRFLQRIAQRLNLTDDQKAQIKAVFRAEKSTVINLRTQLLAVRENLRATIQAPDTNETAVRAASAQVAVVEANLAVERMKIFAKIAPILTDEQRQQLSDLEQRVDAFRESAINRMGDRLSQ
jgi:Spy/CpxP family protein refolding chaperone